MSSNRHGQWIERVRRCQRHLGKLAILFTIAAMIALAWSLLIGPDQPGNGETWTLTPASTGAASSSGAAPGSHSGGSNPGYTGPTGAASVSEGKAQSGKAAGASQPVASSADDIPVYIVGAVARPGIYIVRRNSYLYELVDKAGGLTDDAAAMVINLALKLTENQMVRIPTEAEANDPLNPNPYPSVPGAVTQKTVNINTAPQSVLESLPGIGPATAAAIIADRTKNGPFKQPEDIMRVAGVKESRYEQLEPLISVR